MPPKKPMTKKQLINEVARLCKDRTLGLEFPDGLVATVEVQWTQANWCDWRVFKLRAKKTAIPAVRLLVDTFKMLTCGSDIACSDHPQTAWHAAIGNHHAILKINERIEAACNRSDELALEEGYVNEGMSKGDKEEYQAAYFETVILKAAEKKLGL